MTEENKNIGQRIKQAREYRGYTQEEVADYLNMSRSSLSLIENGKQNVYADELSSLASLFNIQIGVLTGSKEGIDPGDMIQFKLDMAVEDLSPEDRREVARFAEYLATREG